MKKIKLLTVCVLTFILSICLNINIFCAADNIVNFKKDDVIVSDGNKMGDTEVSKKYLIITNQDDLSSVAVIKGKEYKFYRDGNYKIIGEYH